MRAERGSEQLACGTGQQRAGGEQPAEGGTAARGEQLPRKHRWASGRAAGAAGAEGFRAARDQGLGEAATQGRRQGGAEVAMDTPVTQSGGEEER